MRTLQTVFCILACLCVIAAVIVGAFWHSLVGVLCLLLGAVLFGGGMFFVKSCANEKEEREERKNRPDFMNPPDPNGSRGKDDADSRD